MSHRKQVIDNAIEKLKSQFEISEELEKAIRWKMHYVYKKGKKNLGRPLGSEI